jgi:hypothetical protein
MNMKVFGYIMSGIGMIILLVVLVFGLELGGLQWDKFFKPRHSAVERETFKQGRPFQQGKKQQIIKYRMEFLRSNDELNKRAIASTIRMTTADYNIDELEPELRQFVVQMQNYK